VAESHEPSSILKEVIAGLLKVTENGACNQCITIIITTTTTSNALHHPPCAHPDKTMMLARKVLLFFPVAP
jgi:hypothetical protein